MASMPYWKVHIALVLLARVGLIGTFGIFSVKSEANEITVGKYFCYVSHMAGIQVNDTGEISWGRFIPRDEKFFIDIHPRAASIRAL